MKIEHNHGAAHVADEAAHELHHAAHELHHAAHELKAAASELKPAADASANDLAAQNLAASLAKLDQDLAAQQLAAQLDHSDPCAAQKRAANIGKLQIAVKKLEQDAPKLIADIGRLEKTDPMAAQKLAASLEKLEQAVPQLAANLEKLVAQTGAPSTPTAPSTPAPAPTPPKAAVAPAKTPPARPTHPKAPAPKTHVVKPGDTMWDIARNAGVSLKALEHANPHITNPDMIHPGETIRIPHDGHAPVSGGHPSVGQGGHHDPVGQDGHHPPVGQGGHHPHPVGHPHPGGHPDPVGQGGHTEGISAHGREEMASLLSHAKANSGGKPAEGWCLREVEDILDRTTYGKIGHGVMPRFNYAHQFADYLNAGDRYKSLGLKKLDIHNPYDAPPGAIVVVRAGAPGTHHPTAGDISIAAGGGRFLNDGEMGYGGPGGFPHGNNYVLGVYVPA